MSAVEWADEFFFLSPDSSSISGRWKTLPYQVAILNVMCNEEVKKLTLFKSARVGYTKLLVIAWCYFHQHKRRNTLIYQPTDGDATGFVKREIDPAIRDVPILREITKAYGKKSPYNTMSMKTFIGSISDIKGGKSANNYRAMSKDIVIYDEIDGLGTDIEGEGSPLKLGDVRVKNSPFRKSIRGSTPTTEGESNLEVSMRTADVQMRCYVKCLSCDTRQFLKFGDKESKYGIKYQDNGRAGYMCESCQEICPYDKQMEMLSDVIWGDEEKNVWTRDGLTFYSDQELTTECVTPLHVGMYIWTAYAGEFTPWGEILSEFQEAKDDVQSLVTFKNTTLGELWKTKGEAPELSSVLEWKGIYGEGEVQPSVQKITAGVDVQKGSLYVEVRGWSYRQTSYLIYADELFGNTLHQDVWTQLENLLEKGFDGHPVDLCFIDSGYRPEMVYEFCRVNGTKYRPTKGLQTATQLVSTSKQDMTYGGQRYGFNLYRINTHDFKRFVHQRLSKEKDSHGGWHLHKDTSEEYCKQLISETYIETKEGSGKFVWRKDSDNHYFDCAVLNCAAAHVLGVQHLKEKVEYEEEEESLEDLAAALNG